MSRRSVNWNPAKQRRLLARLEGFWAKDVWDMQTSPVQGLSPKANQRRLRFECKSKTINGELKYAFWKRFEGGQWTSTQELTKVHLLVKWLNIHKRLRGSLMERDLDLWKRSYTAYLRRHGMYRMGTTRRMPICPERMIHDEEVPQPTKHQPRYIPSSVLDQLNQHLHRLRAQKPRNCSC